MSNTNNENESVDAAIKTIALYLYERLPDALPGAVAVAGETAVLDVFAIHDADRTELTVHKGQNVTHHKLEPGTYFIFQISGLPPNPDQPPLIAFPLVGN